MDGKTSIGILDSGAGGLFVLKKIKKELPGQIQIVQAMYLSQQKILVIFKSVFQITKIRY